MRGTLGKAVLMKTTLESLLASQGPIHADGGMGTTLFSLGLERGVCPELWNLEHPNQVGGIHVAYIDAGAQIILTNSFGGNRLRLDYHHIGDRVSEVNQAAAHLARGAAENAEAPVVVGGSMGPTGKILAPLGDLEYGQAVSVFEEQARALVEGDVDVLWIETMSDLQEVHAAIEGYRKAASGFPAVVTMTFDTHGHTSMGVSPSAALEALREFDLVAIGGNCGNGPEEIEAVITVMHAADPDLVLVSKANAGLPRLEHGHPVYDASPDVMAEHARRVYGLGARIIGACCGSTPEHIRAMVEALREAS
jgi:5-methyltetrahydrofolate--homocysteine methyltransferase